MDDRIVTNIREFASRETGVVLRELLEQWERGNVRGLVFGYKHGPNRHEVGCTGDYRRDPTEVFRVTARMNHQANRIIDDGA